MKSLFPRGSENAVGRTWTGEGKWVPTLQHRFTMHLILLEYL